MGRWQTKNEEENMSSSLHNIFYEEPWHPADKYEIKHHGSFKQNRVQLIPVTLECENVSSLIRMCMWMKSDV